MKKKLDKNKIKNGLIDSSGRICEHGQILSLFELNACQLRLLFISYMSASSTLLTDLINFWWII